MAELRLGKLQHRIMEVLWERGKATAREITEDLNRAARGKTPEAAHSTVQTILRQLEEKGAVAHAAQGRTFIFRAAVEPDRVRKKATREFVDRLFGGAPGGLAAYLIKHERIPANELDELRRMIDERKGR